MNERIQSGLSHIWIPLQIEVRVEQRGWVPSFRCSTEYEVHERIQPGPSHVWVSFQIEPRIEQRVWVEPRAGPDSDVVSGQLGVRARKARYRCVVAAVEETALQDN